MYHCIGIQRNFEDIDETIESYNPSLRNEFLHTPRPHFMGKTKNVTFVRFCIKVQFEWNLQTH